MKRYSEQEVRAKAMSTTVWVIFLAVIALLAIGAVMVVLWWNGFLRGLGSIT